MIEFKHDGPFRAPDPAPEDHTALIAVGGAAIQILDHLVLECGHRWNITSLDTDEQSIRASVARHKTVLGQRSLHGLGAGGDPVTAADAAVDDIDKLAPRWKGLRAAVVLAGLGGGTGSGAAPLVVASLREQGIATAVIAITPYHFEGERRQQQARAALAAFGRAADVVLTFSNDRLLNLPEARADIRQGLHSMNRLLAQAAVTTATILSGRGALALKPADLKNIALDSTRDGIAVENCWIGLGEAGGEDRLERVVEQAMASPLFEDGRVWKQAAGLIASLSTGEDLTMGELQQAVAMLKDRLPVDLEISAGATLDPSLGDKLRLVLIAATPEKSAPGEIEEELVVPESKPRKAKRETRHQKPEIVAVVPEPDPDYEPESEFVTEEHEMQNTLHGASTPGLPLLVEDAEYAQRQQYFARQEELGLDQKISRGIFEKSAPTIRNGQDLDTPTFLRRNLKIRV